jgi:hypothetical protein
MRDPAAKDNSPHVPSDGVRVPAGAPAWVTDALIAKTLKVWQPRYDRPLTREDALELILNAVNFADALRRIIA